MNLPKLAWKNLTNKPLSMALSLILFGLGVGLISLLFLLEKQLQDNFERNLAGIDLVVGAKGSPLQMILCSMYHIDAPTGNVSLGEVRPFLNPKHPLIDQAVPLALGDSYQGSRIVGTDQNILDLYEVEIGEGKVWENNFEVTAGAAVAEKLGLKLGSEFNSSHGFMDSDKMEHDHATPFRVSGILKPSGTVLDQLLLTTPQSFWLVHDHEEAVEEEHEEHEDHAHHDHDHDHAPEPPKSLLDEDPEKEITSLLLTFKGRSYQSLNLARNINENTDLQAASPAIEINRLFNLMDTGERALRMLAIIITIVSGLSIFISLFSSLRDRRYELALMRVMGGRPTTLFNLIVIEGVLLALMGFVFGMILSHTGMYFLAGALEESYRYNFSAWVFQVEDLYLLVGSLILGMVAAVIPATQASKTDISDTLTQ
ncbi:MAG: FtsX-like permease family protein [Bacteroidetes bacterium]|nr:FtsX-like permease family protein [Bacteroidota bacterium]